MMSDVSGRPPRWVSWTVGVAAAVLGARAAATLPYPSGRLWLVGLCTMAVLVVVGLATDRVTHSNPGRAKRPVRRAFAFLHLLTVVLLVQLPAAGWRLYEGDPDVRAAKAYCEGVAQETWESLDEQGRIDSAHDATVLPGVRDLPRFVHEHGIWFGVRDGRAHLGFQVERPGRVDRYAYDIDRGRWSRSGASRTD